MTKINYPAGDFLIRIKNAVMAENKNVAASKTKLIKAIAELLQKKGYLRDVEEKDGNLIVTLAYKSKKPVISDIYLISKPGKRVYKNTTELRKYRKPYKLLISTPSGLMLSDDALEARSGGEVIAGIL